jgi:hypothetical protein
VITVNNFLGIPKIIIGTRNFHPYKKELFGNRKIFQAFNFFNLTTSSIEKIKQTNNKWLLNYISEPDELKVNSNYFRSDEFKKEHDGLHILFSGCSVTYGLGLYAKETWSHKLYNKIKDSEKVSGYYNLALPGTGTMDIVANIFKYIDMYKKPDVIFINLPNPTRFYFLWDSIMKNTEIDWDYRYTNNMSEYYYSAFPFGDGSDKFSESVKINVYQYLLMLNLYCKANNIKLYIFSYIDATYRFLKDFTDIENVYEINSKDLNKKIFQYVKENPKDEFAMKARDQYDEKDRAHLGTAFHDGWAQIMYNYYKESQ